jgi:hypothetical protein
MLEKEVVEFKTVSPLFEMERDGVKKFTTRLLERTDGRRASCMAVQYRLIFADIKITNPETGESFTRQIKHISFVPWTHELWLNIHW